MKFALRSLAVAALALAVAQSASAAFQITQVEYFGSAGAPLTTPFSTNLTFNQFDSTQGTLTGVTVQLNDSTTVISQAVSYGAGTSSFTNFTNTGTVTILGPDGTGVSTSLSTVAGSGSVSGLGTVITVDSETNNNLVSGPLSVSSANFASYIGSGAGTFAVSAAGGNTFGGSSSGSVAAGGSVTSYGYVTLVYTYTPTAVPEPASMAMLAIGLGGVFAVRRIRRRAV